MVDNILRIPEFVLNISNFVLLEINKFGEVLYANDKAKCIFNKIDINKNLKVCIGEKNWFVFDKNIETVLYNQYQHHFYWDYKNRFYIVYVYPDNASVWIGFEDITEKRQLSHLLYLSSQKNSFFEKVAKSGYWELDLIKKRFYWSAGMYRLFEMNDNDLNCQRNLIRELILPQDMHLYKKELKNILKYKKDISGFIRIITKNNKIKKCRFGAGMVYENGEEKIAGVFVDMSDCVLYGCERCNYLSENFNCLLAKAFHDLKQPISTMKFLLGDIEKYVLEKGKKYLKKMDDVNDNLNSMISDTLNFAKNNQIVGEKFDIKNVIKKICDEYFEEIEKKGIKLILNLREYEVCQNLFLTEKIIRNLLGNAVKFTDSKIMIKNIDGCFWIVDDGCGIDKKEQKHIVDDFFQCNTLTKNKAQGTGLGLGIAYYSASIAGGYIKVKSRKGYYTVFKVCL